MLLTGALCAVQPNKEFTVFVKWLPALAVLGVLYAYPAHAAEPLEDASEALENLDDLVKSVGSVGHSFGRIVQPRQYGFRWNGGGIGRGFNTPRLCLFYTTEAAGRAARVGFCGWAGHYNTK